MSFDLTVHHRNSKGKISKVSPYKLKVENGVKKFLRGGLWYFENGEQCEPGATPIARADAQAIAVLKEVVPSNVLAELAELKKKLADKDTELLEKQLELNKAQDELDKATAPVSTPFSKDAVKEPAKAK